MSAEPAVITQEESRVAQISIFGAHNQTHRYGRLYPPPLPPSTLVTIPSFPVVVAPPRRILRHELATLTGRFGNACALLGCAAGGGRTAAHRCPDRP